MNGFTMMRQGVLGLAILSMLGACSYFDDDEERLEGERIRVRDQQAAVGQTFTGSVPALPEPRRNAAWTQTNGRADHASGHLAGPASPSLAWRADAGTGAESGVTSAPIISNGRVFTLDAAAQLSAFEQGSGSLAWRADLAPEGEDGEDGFGGGLASEAGTVYATTGFGEVIAVQASTGEVLWRYRARAPFRAAPAVENGLVLAVTRDNRAIALGAGSGDVVWRIDGTTADAALLGGASPAMQSRLAVVPFASGELVGVDAATGRTVWNAVLGGARRGLARASIADVTGDPVIVGRAVVAANQSGRIVAIDGQTGRRGWTRSIGSTGPIWAAGGSLFMVSDDSAVVRLAAQTGQTIWRQELPAYEDVEDREDPIAYSGPVVVNNRVLVTSSIGQMLSFDAATGNAGSVVQLSAPTTTGVAVADGTLYVLTDDATLQAFR